MKLILYILLTSILFISCDSSSSGNETIDSPPIIVNPISNIEVDLNSTDRLIDISNVFIDNDGDSLTYTASSTNSVTSSILGTNLTLSFTEGMFGLSEIQVTATSNGVSVTDTFNVKIIDTSVSTLESASTIFSSKEYDSSAIIFKSLISHQSDSVKSKAYVGLGYSLMRSGKLSESYSTFLSGYAIGHSIGKSDLLSGLALLEYAFKGNYAKAIEYSNILLNMNNNFQMMFDPKVDSSDIILTLAQSYFALTNYTECLNQIQKLGYLNDITSEDSELQTKLLNKLNELSDIYN